MLVWLKAIYGLFPCSSFHTFFNGQTFVINKKYFLLNLGAEDCQRL